MLTLGAPESDKVTCRDQRDDLEQVDSCGHLFISILPLLEGIKNLNNLHTKLAIRKIGQGSLTPVKYCVQSWVQVQIFSSVQSCSYCT